MLHAAPLSAVRLALSFAIAFAVYEALLFAFELVAGGMATFTAPIVAQLLGNEAAWLVGLAILYGVLTRTAPGVFGTAPTLRLA